MKNIKRFIILMLVFAVVSALLVSCGETENAVATYGENNYIYAEDSDFSDFYHLYTYYHKIESTDDKMSSAEYNTILRDAVKTTVEMRLLEDEISRRGYSVDMEKVEEAANIDKNVFEKAYPGGFSAFCEHWGVSADVFVTLNKFEALCEVAKESFFTTEKVTEAEAEVYYEKNEDDFVRKPHYEIKELYLQVMDGVEKESVFNDAKVYIGMVNTGRSWENVFNTAIIKYNLENGMNFSHYLSGTKIIEKDILKNVDSITLLKNTINEEFESQYGCSYDKLFPGGFDAYIEDNGIEVGSVTYKRCLEAHINYCSKMYQVELNYAIMEKWETGKCYEFPVYHSGFESYVIIYFSSSEDEEGKISFEEAKEDIIAIIDAERKEEAFNNFISEKIGEAKVKINND
jgi:hypothetical protein